MNSKTKSALRSTLQQESEALEARLPETVPAVAGGETPVVAAPAEAEVAKPAKAAKTAKTARPASAPKPAARTAAKAAPKAAKAPAKAVKPVVAAEQAAPAAEKKADKPVKAPKVAKAEKPEKAPKAAREKVVRDSFSMPKTEHNQLKTLRESLAKAGRICTKSELLRAGVQFLLKESTAGTRALVEGLVAVPKCKGAK